MRIFRIGGSRSEITRHGFRRVSEASATLLSLEWHETVPMVVLESMALGTPCRLTSYHIVKKGVAS